MRQIKHIGRIKNTGTKVVVVFRTLPGESNMALVLPVSTLPDLYHDALMTVIESDQSQDAFEFGEIMFSRSFPDGRPMLQAMQADNRLHKVATDTVIMTPTTNDNIELAQLNLLIAEQKNCAVDDLYTFVSGAPKKSTATVEEVVKVKDLTPETPVENSLKAPENTALSDTDIAKNFRSQADALYKEAARLRKQADELDPPKKKTAKATETADA
jgi:hypothetical protein